MKDLENKSLPLKAKIIIGVPVYNEEKYIVKTLQSIKNQTCTDFKVLISDNCSTDRSGEIILSEIAGDSRFYYFRQGKNSGGSGNWNFILNNIECEYVSVIGAHDTLEKDFIKILTKALDKDSEISLAGSYVREFNDNNELDFILKFNEFNYADNNPKVRLLSILSNSNKCAIVNHFIRFEFLRNLLPLPVSRGPDVALLALLNYKGIFYIYPAVLYNARGLYNRSASYAERLSGKVQNNYYIYYLLIKFVLYVLNRIFYSLDIPYSKKLHLLGSIIILFIKQFLILIGALLYRPQTKTLIKLLYRKKFADIENLVAKIQRGKSVKK